ncbi:CAP domain-containing protein [Halomonas sp. DWK9]|uniref:CAP domain-containing protein n=1 Tax=Halomonas sp. DWK9 TaxID=3060155 RepID=UPI00287FF11F|nr:CAP domain-containing protein [Halomonas sp. DWK9]
MDKPLAKRPMIRALFSTALTAAVGVASHHALADSATSATSTACALTEQQQHMLERVNEARHQARQCGEQSFETARPLTWSCPLNAAAQAHANDMAANDYVSHTGQNGSGIGERATQAGYTWRTIGENIAAGHTTADAAIQSWLESPGHCQNLMNDDFTEMGMAQAENTEARFTHYWVKVLGAPR